MESDLLSLRMIYILIKILLKRKSLIKHLKPKRLSDTELEYELPTGEEKIYRIEE